MVIYFSGTGNSRYAAESIAAIVGDTLTDSAAYIREKNSGEFRSDKPYVFVCPTYGWRIPRVFSNFIETGTFKGSSAAYFVLTCGDSMGGAAMDHEMMCNGKGFRYKGTAAVVMPENYVAMFSVPDEEESDRMIAAADVRLGEIGALIAEEKKLPDVNCGIGGRLESKLINPLFYAFFVNSNGFRVNEKACTACGICAAGCPLGNIYLKDLRPYWGVRCTHCMACIARCPEKAIDFKKKTVGKRRYLNNRIPPVKRENSGD